LSSFWTKDFDPIQRDAFNAVYEAGFAVLDAEYVRLAEINKAKGLLGCPLNSQRRWLRLDLNRYDDLNAFLKFIQSDSVTGSSAASSSSDTLQCSPIKKNHPRHWHIQFPYVVPAGDAISRSTINLTYPTELALVTVHRMKVNPVTGRKEAFRLKPSTDYLVLPNDSSIRLLTTTPGDEFELNVAFNFTDESYKELKPVTAYAAGIDRLGPNVIPVPVALSTANLAIHALVVRNIVDNGTGGLDSTNNITFTTTYEFYPYTGDTTGPLHGAVGGTVALPSTIVPLSVNDAVFVFGLIVGEWDIAHRHDIATTILNPAASPFLSGGIRAPGSQSVVEFDKLIQPGVFNSLGHLGQTLEVYIDGALLHTSEYRLYDNKLHLKTPLVWAAKEFVSVDVRFSVEYNTIQNILGDQHLHYVCAIAIANPVQNFAPFDDGGEFDTDPEDGLFDDSYAINVLYISDVLADPSTLEVFINGVYANKGIDYFATLDPTSGRIFLSFTAAITGKSILVTYRRETRTFIYGAFDSSSFGNGLTGGTRATLSGLLSDVQGLLASFGSTYVFNAQNSGRLVEAAAVAAAGGNPFLTLFFDEYDEYSDLPIDAANQAFSSLTARTLESYSTELTSIPFLVDHVHNPTVRLREGQDFDVKAGSILSSFDLLASRGPEDDQPGVWWCPVVLFDEHFLSKNFGSLVGDVRDSTVSYQQELLASYALRFVGPVFQNTAWTLAALLGSPSFTQDGTVVSTSQTITGYRVTVGNSASQQVAFVPSGTTPLTVGIDVVPTQSLSQAPVFNGAMQSFVKLENSVLTLQLAIRPEAGDVIKFSIVNPADPAQTPIPFTSRVISSEVNTGGLYPFTQIVMRDEPRYDPVLSASLLILRQGNPPYATISGTILSIQPVYETVVRTTHESFTLPEGTAAEQRVGEHIFRGMPLFPSYAELYDDTTRPNWHWVTPADVVKNYRHKIAKLGSNVAYSAVTDYRTAVVNPAAASSSYSLLSMTPQAPIPPRGSKIVLTDAGTDDDFSFTVIGSHGSGVFVTPAVSIQKTGDIVVSTLPAAGLSDFFEAPSPLQNATIETTQTFPQLVRSTSMQVVSTALFPSAGRIAIRLPNGGATEFTYTSVSNGFFLDCTWPSDFPAMTGISPGLGIAGNLNPLIPLAAVFRLVSAFTTRRINPAFIALVNNRVTQDLVNSTPTVTVTESNVEALYALTKTGATVFESRAITYPAALTDVLINLVPTTTSMISLSKHVIIDVYAGGVNEN
jgi:hypothetical protein